MNISLLSDTPFGDEHAFLDFLGRHAVAHKNIATRLTLRGQRIDSVPLSEGPIDHPDWLLDHEQIHRDIATMLNQPLPDLSTVDLLEEDQYLDWMYSHGQLHDQINAALGIYS